MLIEERPTRLPGVRLFVRPPQSDARGSFRRCHSQSEYATVGLVDDFVEDNVSVSKRGVLRGLHYDLRLAKFVQVLVGRIHDVVVDVRRASPTFGQWEAFDLDGEGGSQLYVPRGFAHGFYVLSESAVMAYKQTAPYDPASEGQLLWNDPAVGIDWPLAAEPLVSEKDRRAPPLAAVP